MKTKQLDYSKKVVVEKLEKFDITQNQKTRTVKTMYDGAVLTTYTPSKEYQMIDFKKVGIDFINKMSDYMTIKTYDLIVRKGIQELRLFGEDFNLAGEVYRQQAVLISSTDGTRTLSVMIGLWRQVCSNGMMRKISGEAFRVRHLKSNNKVIKTLSNDYGDLDKAFKSLKSQVEKLQKKTITLEEIRTAVVKEDGKGAQKFLAFAAKLYTSKTDRLEYKTVPADYKKVIRRLTDEVGRSRIEISPEILKMKKLDIKLNAYQAFQCYTEMVRAWDGAVIETETEKFLELVG